jgi:hypothetical protein
MAVTPVRRGQRDRRWAARWPWSLPALAAIRWHGRSAAELDALIGRFGLVAALAPGS